MPQKIRRLARTLTRDAVLSTGDVDQLIEAAKDGPRVTSREKAALKRLLTKYDSNFEPAARRRLEEFLGLARPQEPGGEGEAVSREAAGIDRLDKVAEGFLAEYQARKSEFGDEKKLYGLFQDYVGALHRNKEGQSSTRVAFEQEKLLKAYEKLEGAAYGKVDADRDGLGRAAEAVYGTDAAKADTDADGVVDGKELKAGSSPLDRTEYSWMAERRAWNDTNYWPMAGSGGVETGDASRNMWADGSPLDRLDTILEKRTGERGKALEYERKSALSWLVGKKGGSFVPYSSVRESDAEVTTGVDFDGDGKITKGVRADFLDRFGNFVAASRWDAYLGETRLDKKIATGEDGEKAVEYTKPDGTKLTEEEREQVYLAPIRSGRKAGDAELSGSTSVGWWGRCDGMAHVGTVFDEPKRSVTVEGVTFTPNDIKGLLGIMAESLAGPSATNDAWVGHRFDDEPEILVTRDGQQVRGKLLTEGVDFRASDMWRWNGDYMVLETLEATPKDKLDARLDGKPVVRRSEWSGGERGSYLAKEDGSRLTEAERGRLQYGVNFMGLDGKKRFVPMDEIRYLAKEDVEDVNPAKFHETLDRWIGKQGTAGVMDSYAGGQVWNYNYWKADVKEATEGYKPEKNGFAGPANPENRVVKYDMDLHFGKSDYPKNYSYWVEYDKDSGKAVNGGWLSQNPDFLWRHPKDAPVSWNGALERNPYVDVKLIKEIYEKSISE